MREIEEVDNDYPSVPKIRAKLKFKLGTGGHHNDVHVLQKEVKAERTLNSSGLTSSTVSELLPTNVEAVIPLLKSALAQPMWLSHEQEGNDEESGSLCEVQQRQSTRDKYQ